MLKPYKGYILGKEIESDSGVVTTSNIEDSVQKYEVVAVGDSFYEFGELITPDVKAGDTVYVQKHANADTPKELEDQGLALFQANRIMLTETE